jgi:large subunit ribosomal protein L32e
MQGEEKMSFLRTSTRYYKRLGRKKNLRWRKPRGRHNKIREGVKGKQRKVKIGFKTSEKIKAILIRNMREAEKITKGQIVIIAKLGGRKRKDIEKKIAEMGGKILNIK